MDQTVLLENPSANHQEVCLDSDTEVLDVQDSVASMSTQTLDHYEEEVVPDSDDEGTNRAEVTSLEIAVNGLELEKRQLTVSKQCYAGYLKGQASAVSAHVCDTSGSDRSSMTGVGTDSGPSSTYDNNHSRKELGTRDDETSRIVDQLSAGEKVRKVSRLEFINKGKVRDMVGGISVGNMFNEIKISLSDCLDKGERDTGPFPHDHDLPRPCYIESQEPGEESQENALDFVDRYLLVNELSRECENGNSVMKLQPVLNARGPLNLARKANLKFADGKLGNFDWFHNLSDGEEAIPIKGKERTCYGCSPRYIAMPQTDGDPNFSNDKSLCLQRPKTLEVMMLNSNNLDSQLKESVSNITGGGAEVSQKKIDHNFIRELDELFDAESTGQQLELADSGSNVLEFDIGFNTQMAAEAIEALVSAPFPVSKDIGADQPSSKSLEHSPDSLKKERTSKSCAFIKGIDFHSGVITKKSKKTNNFVSKLNRKNCTSFENSIDNPNELDPEQPAKSRGMGQRPVTKKCCGKSFNVISRQIKMEYIKKEDIEEFDTNVGWKKLPTRKCRTSLSIAQKSISPSVNIAEVSVNSCEDVKNVAVEVGPIRKIRKSSSLYADVFQELGLRGKCSNLGSITSEKATKRNVDQHGRTNVDLGAADCRLELQLVSCPKGKRTCRSLSDHSNEARATVTKEEDSKNFIKNQNMLGVNDRATCFSRDAKEKTDLLVYRRRVRSSSGYKPAKNVFEQNIGETSLVDVTKCESSDMEVPNQSGKPDVVNSICYADNHNTLGVHDRATCVNRDAKEKAELLVYRRRVRSSSGNKPAKSLFEQNFGEISLVDVTKCESSDMKVPNQPGKPDVMNSDDAENLNMDAIDKDAKQPSKKSLLKSPLLKELIRLGHVESPPDFMPKDGRRRKNAANVRVLFSQNLDGSLLDHQKKILARLGFSIASCCSDATHFVADRFVRTRNMLDAIAFGKPIVTPLWLEICGQASCFIDEKNYILRDAKKETEIGFCMPVSLALATRHPLLKGRRVFATPHVKPSKELLECLVKAVHGQALKSIPIAAMRDKMNLDDLLIISCEQDHAICVPFLETGAKVYDAELLLNGIIIQKLEYERHQLFTNHVKRKRYQMIRRKTGDR